MKLTYKNGSTYLNNDNNERIMQLFYFSSLLGSYPVIMYTVDTLSQIMKLELGESVTHVSTKCRITRIENGFNILNVRLDSDEINYQIDDSEIERFCLEVVTLVGLKTTCLSYS